MTSKLTLKAKTMSIVAVAIATLSIVALLSASASAAHNPAVVSYETGECGETAFSVEITDPNGGHIVSNMYLVISAEGNTQYVKVPVDGSSADLTTGPLSTNPATVSWNIFGGGERDYDQPLWDGYGTGSFGADIANYASGQGGYSWVLDGPDTPNPFVNWNEFEVEGCPPPAQDTDKQAETTKAEAKSDETPKEKTSEQEVVKPVGGVNAGGGGASATSVASIFGLLASSAAFGFGLLRGFIRIGG